MTRRYSSLLPTALSCLAYFSGCNHDVRRFPNAAPRWEDHDRNHVPEEPKEYYSGMIADAADKNFLRPLARLPYLPLPERSRNVNALDEVPNSSWFQNRIGFYDISPERVAHGACGDTPPLDPNEKWTIIAAKPNGAYPGFFIETGNERYLLKFDSPVQPGRATSADVIGSKIYWAAGFHTPCNEIIYFERDILAIDPEATAEDRYGRKHPISQADIDAVLDKAYRTKDGIYRASASRFLPGRPLGPFKYQGLRGDDPNDHVRHEHRRELRGSRILSAWLHHHDAREQNTLDVWMEDQGKNEDRDFIRHYVIDFGDCLGSRWFFDPLTRRFGYSYFVSGDQALVDLVTLGAFPRPWHEIEVNPEVEIFGYFNVKDFRPKTWVTEYPNAAFSEMRYDDALWMSRILSRFSREHIEAIVAEAKLHNAHAEQYLVDTLLGRRDVILREYFTEYAPLDRFRVVRRKEGELTQSLCFEDLAIAGGIVKPERTLYKGRFYGGRKLDQEMGWLQFTPDPEHPHRSCIQLPLGHQRPADLAPQAAADDHPLRYGVLKLWIHQEPGVEPTSAIHLYFYDLGAKRGYRLVGIERPSRPHRPDLY